MHTLSNFINGEFVACANHIESLNPATGALYARVPDSDASDVELAVQAAEKAFPSWSKTTRQYRSDMLNKIAQAIEAKLDEFALAESCDQGKPVSLAKRVDIPRACYNFRFFAGAILYSTEKSTHQEQFSTINVVTRNPVGIAGLITPWNLPLYLLTWKIAPALATGNVVVCKPSELTSVTAFLMAQVMKEVGLPPGVCNIVFGYGHTVGSAIVSHPKIPLVSFTGGTVTGKRISELSAPFQKRLSLELGGKNPALVFDDVDLEAVVSNLLISSFANQGEICLCSSRLYVQKSIFDKFIELFVKGAREIVVGAPDDPNTKMGALVSKQHLEKVRSYVAIAKEEGAKIHCGEGVDELQLPEANKQGYFMRPTIVTGLTDDSRCIQEEIFGPVVCVMPFDTEEEVVGRANNTIYGLSATVWCKDGARAQRVAADLQAGTVWVNCWMIRDLNMPFGGVKSSGTGRESAEDSINFYTDTKTICTKFG
eukprot:m.119653 g.119653  ORF g.119653 m.119653 type:complete len:483 (-) comp23192_c0_seq1:104-1552(-)